MSVVEGLAVAHQQGSMTAADDEGDSGVEGSGREEGKCLKNN